MLPLAFLAWGLTFAGFLGAFEINPDEGVNFAKAAAVHRGHPLYAAVWSDQPPLLTHLLSGLASLFGQVVAPSRALLLLASTWLAWRIGVHLQRTAGLHHALAAQALVLAQPTFHDLASAVMVGLPAIHLAFASCFAAVRATVSRKRAWLVASALLFAASVMTKLFTLAAAPALLLYLAVPVLPTREGLQRSFGDALAWSLVAACAVAVVFFGLVGWEDSAQLVAGHALARGGGPGGLWSAQTLFPHLQRIPWLVAAFAPGALLVLLRRDREGLLFAGWAVVAAILLATHSPVWFHQLLLFTLPAAVVAGYGVGEALRFAGTASRWASRKATVASVCVALAFVVLVQFLQGETQERRAIATPASSPAIAARIEEMRRLAGPDGTVVTDRPMMAWRAGLQSPPWIAVLTEKRMATRQLTEAELVQEVRSHAPDLVLLARFRLPKLHDLVERTYHRSDLVGLGALYSLADGFGRPKVRVGTGEWSIAGDRPLGWYGSGEARATAARVLATQGPNGGWPKTPQARGAVHDADHGNDDEDETLDNSSTTGQMAFLLRMLARGEDPRLRESLRRGEDFLFSAQYPSGCWPQVHPHRFSYHSLCTLNDGVTVRAAGYFQAALRTRPRLTFVELDRKMKAEQALARAIAFFLRAQVRIDGRLTGWCQQYDPETLAPAPARAFEPVALASRETAEVLALLMQQPKPSEALKAAVKAGVDWLHDVRIEGLRVVERPDPSLPKGKDRVAVDDPLAPPVWARHYSIPDQKPLFLGRDRAVHERFNDLEAERRAGYDYLLHDAAAVFPAFAAWCVKHGCPPATPDATESRAR